MTEYSSFRPETPPNITTYLQLVNMKKCVIILHFLFVSVFAKQLISVDEASSLFSKYVKGNLTDNDEVTLTQLYELLHGSFDSLDTLSPNRRTLTCRLCISTLSAFFDQVHNGETEEDLLRVFSTLCVNLGIMTPAVCHGAVKLNLPILMFIIRNTPEATPSTFCGMVLQSGTDPYVCPIEDARFEWAVDIPPSLPLPPGPPPGQQRSNRSSNDLKIALIADAHLDPVYEAFGVANCDEPTCCRIGQREALIYDHRSDFNKSIIEEALAVSDDNIFIDLNQIDLIKKLKATSTTRVLRRSEPAGYWGDYRDCDTPIWAYDDLIERIAEAHKDVDMVYYMGDTIDHGIWETTYDLINDMNAYFINKLRNTLGPDVPVIPVIGNHESQPTNQFAPPHIREPGLDTHWLYQGLADKWRPYLDANAIETLLDRGDFSMRLKNNLRVISLNTNAAYVWNWWVVYDPREAKRHLDWLVSELASAEMEGESVHILTHFPPGAGDLTRTWTREYNRIVNRFSSIIKAEFNGHGHGDEFRIFYSLDDHRPNNMAWIIGSATAYRHYNLNYKIATFNKNTYDIINFENYIYNLTEANLTPHRRPHWFRLYNFRNSFNLPDLSPASMDNLVTRMATTENQLLNVYSAFQPKISDNRWPYCDLNCKLNNLCRTVITELWERDRCNELRDLYLSNN